MINSANVKSDVIKSLIKSSNELLGDFQGAKVSINTSQQYFNEVHEQVSLMKQFMKETYKSMNAELEGHSITGTPDELSQLARKLEKLHQKILGLDAVIGKAESLKKTIGEIAGVLKSHDQEYRKMGKKDKALHEKLTQLYNEKNALKSTSHFKTTRVFGEKVPLFQDSKLSSIKEQIEAKREELSALNEREEELEELDGNLERSAQVEIEAFQKQLKSEKTPKG